MMKISIALCTYNGEKYINDQLSSFINQTRRPDEVIICDDRSTDKTISIINSFIEISPFPIKIHVNHQNLGSTKNFERAIQLCTGDIIFLSDQDDVWLPDKIETIINIFENSLNIGMVFSDAKLVDANLNPLNYNLSDSILFNRKEQNKFKKKLYYEVLLKHNVVTGATMAFKAEYKKQILPIPETWIHDAWIAFILAAFSDLVYINKPLILYRQHFEQQIGAIKKSFKEKAQFSLQRDKNAYEYESKNYTLALNRLKNIADLGIILSIKGKIIHFHNRAIINQQSYFYRLPLILKELVTLRYLRYSSKGLLSAFRDLIYFNNFHKLT